MANQYDTNLKLQAIADAIGDTSSSGLISALEDIADAVAGGGGGSSTGLVSDNFSETDTYDLGDYCIHNNTLYVCINAITTPGPWDLSDWQATNAGLELSSLNSALGNKQNIETNVTLLRQSNTAAWAELSISDINQYSHIIISVSPQNSNIEYFPLVVPTAYFKTKVSTSNYMGGYFNIGTSNYGFGAYYKNDTTVGLYISSTSYFVNIKGIK